VAYEDGEQMIAMGGALNFAVFAKRLGWSYESREELCAELADKVK
jgi:hypothetical protein